MQPALSEETLRQLLAEQLGGAVQQLADQQEELLEELRGQPQVGRCSGCQGSIYQNSIYVPTNTVPGVLVCWSSRGASHRWETGVQT